MNNPFIMLAPMEGVVDAVVRALFSEIGGYDRFVTEFVRVTDKVLPPSVLFHFCPELKTGGRTKEGVPVFIQFLGGDPQLLGENAACAAEVGAPGIDLNFGCPARTVNRRDGGATLLKNPHRLFDVISSVRKAVPANIPVTAKVRLGFDHKDSVLEIARAVDEAGASMLTVHARTKMEGYQPPAHWEYIGRMREVVHIPVVANGDIWTVEDYLRCREISGCESVALGRSAMATPDLALQIKAFLGQEERRQFPWMYIQKTLIPQFIHSSGDMEGRPHRVVGRTKQWLKQLGFQHPEAQTLFEQIKTAKSTEEILGFL